MNNSKTRFHLIGRPGKGWAWVSTEPFKKRVNRQNTITDQDEAELLGLIDILKYAARGSQVRIISDSMTLCEDCFNENLYDEPPVVMLRRKAKTLIRERDLEVVLKWVSEYEHFAAKLFVPTD